VGGGAHVLPAGSELEDELRDYERLAETSETLVYMAMTWLMVKMLARV